MGGSGGGGVTPEGVDGSGGVGDGVVFSSIASEHYPKGRRSASVPQRPRRHLYRDTLTFLVRPGAAGTVSARTLRQSIALPAVSPVPIRGEKGLGAKLVQRVDTHFLGG
jgi:hypothetical protein